VPVLFIRQHLGADIFHAAPLVTVEHLAQEDLHPQADRAFVNLGNALGEEKGGESALASGGKQDAESV